MERLLRTVSRQNPHSLALNETVLGPEGDLVSSCRSLSGSLRLLDGSASPCILGWWVERDLPAARRRSSSIYVQGSFLAYPSSKIVDSTCCYQPNGSALRLQRSSIAA